MAQYVEVKGQVIEFPDGMTAPDIEAAIKRNMMAIPPEKPAAVKAGGMLNQIPRQVGLAARYGIEGLADTAQIFTEPLRNIQNMVTGGNARPLGEVARSAADFVGLPSPQSANERVIGDATRFVAGSGGVIKGAQAAAKGATGVAQKAFSLLASNPGAQLAASAGGGLAGGASREAGGTAPEQIGASVLGTVLGGLAPGAASGIVTRFNNLKASPMQLEGRIQLALREGGIDWQSLPTSVRAQLLTEVKQATSTGRDLNPDAVRRLADFKATNTVPTRGMLSLDPVQITREQNLAKIGANTADDGLQGLARVQNQNNSQLVTNLNQLGASRGDLGQAGAASINRIVSRDAQMQDGVTNLYRAARDLPGGAVPLRRDELVNNIYNRLTQENKLAFLPSEISSMIDQISGGVIKRGDQTFNVPFDANALDNLMTTIATAQRGTRDGNVKAALNIVRKAIDDTPVTPIKTEYGGNQVVTSGGAQYLRDQDATAPEFMDALNRARSAARERFQWQESSSPVAAALDGAQPEKYVQRFVINGSFRDAEALAQQGDRTAIRDAIMAHLKDKAVNGASDEVAKFSQSAFNKALKQIGESKLGLFFEPEEIQQLQANARAASYMQTQPVGSAVNNSNSGALMMGRGYDFLNNIAGKLPMGKQLVVDPLRNIDISLSQRQAQNTAPALLMPQQRSPMPMLLAPGFSFGGLLSAPEKP